MATPTCHDRIMLAPEHLVKAVLLSVCKDQDVEKIVLARLDALTELEKSAAQVTDRKRKATDEPAICVQCETPFYKDDNHYEDCLYHPGEMEPDYENDFWADHDEDCHGTIDSDWARKEYPGGFIWDCCDKNAEEFSGCTKGRHEADPHKAFKEASGAEVK